MLTLATLALMTLVSLAMFFASTVFLSRLMPSHRALRWWMAGAGCMLLGGLLLTLRGIAPAFLPVVLGTTVSLTGAGLVVIALRQTLSAATPRAWLWLIAAANLVIQIVFTYAVDDSRIRVAANSLLIASVLAYGAWSMLRLPPMGQPVLVRTTGVIFALGTLPYLARGFLSGDDPLSTDLTVQPSAALALPQLYAVILFLWLSVLVANLVSYQIRAELISQRDEAEAAHRRLEQISRCDHLTGLGNRRSTAEELARQADLARGTGTSLSIVALDLDHFKRVNDTRGHAVGDAVLVAVARALNDTAPPAATVGRWGGEEFLVLLPGMNRDAAAVVAGELRTAIGQASHEWDASVTASLGVATWRAGDDTEALLRRADQALYRAKDAGRNRVVTG